GQDAPGLADLFPIGTAGVIKKMARGPEGVEILVQGAGRVRLLETVQKDPYLRANVLPLPAPEGGGEQVEALNRAVFDAARRVLELARPQADIAVNQFLSQAPNPISLAYPIASMPGPDAIKAQAILAAES